MTNPTGWEEKLEKDFGNGDGGIVGQKAQMILFFREEIAAAKQEQWGIDHQEMAQEVDMAYKAGQHDLLEKVKGRIGMLRQWLNEDRISDPTKMVTNEDLESWFSLEDPSKEL